MIVWWHVSSVRYRSEILKSNFFDTRTSVRRRQHPWIRDSDKRTTWRRGRSSTRSGCVSISVVTEKERLINDRNVNESSCIRNDAFSDADWERSVFHDTRDISRLKVYLSCNRSSLITSCFTDHVTWSDKSSHENIPYWIPLTSESGLEIWSLWKYFRVSTT